MFISAKAGAALVAWLRNARRAAWLLIAFSLIVQMGDAIVEDAHAATPFIVSALS